MPFFKCQQIRTRSGHKIKSVPIVETAKDRESLIKRFNHPSQWKVDQMLTFELAGLVAGINHILLNGFRIECQVKGHAPTINSDLAADLFPYSAVVYKELESPAAKLMTTHQRIAFIQGSLGDLVYEYMAQSGAMPTKIVWRVAVSIALEKYLSKL